METISITVDHVRELRESGPGYALFYDGDSIMVARESADTAELMIIGSHGSLEELADGRRELPSDLVTDTDLADDLSDIAGDYLLESERAAVAHAKIAPITRCLADHGIVRTGPAWTGWTKRHIGSTREIVQNYGAGAAPDTRIEITTGLTPLEPFRVTVDNGITGTVAKVHHGTPPAAIAALIKASLVPTNTDVTAA